MDGTDGEEILKRKLKICQKENLNMDKYHFFFFGEMVIRHDVEPDPHKL